VLSLVFILQHLRQTGVVGKFVEFFGPGVAHLSIADRATIANMCPEYGATVGYFPVDEKSLLYLRQTGNLCYFSSLLSIKKKFKDACEFSLISFHSASQKLLFVL